MAAPTAIPQAPAAPTRTLRPMPPPPRPPNGAQAAATPRFTLADISTTGREARPRIVFYGPEGVGKTSFGAYAPNPIFIQSRGETGVETLIAANQIPPTAHLPECQNWQDILHAVSLLLNDQHDYRTVVIDTINGAERLAQEHICATQFGNDWGPNGFGSYGKGALATEAIWKEMLVMLDRLRTERNMGVLMLAHSATKSDTNPIGADILKYTVDMGKPSWSITKKWCDAILFCTRVSIVKDVDTRTKRGKGVGGANRIILTDGRDAFEAKNRWGLPYEIDCGACAADAWDAFELARAAAHGGIEFEAETAEA